MGSGESTARRISMQRTEEGVIQIHQDVMSRLRNEGVKETITSPDEEEFVALLKKAFEEGQAHEAKKWKEEKASLLQKQPKLPESALTDADKLWKHRLEQKEMKIAEDEQNVIAKEEEIRQKLRTRRKQIQDKFETTAQEIQDRFRPLQSASICQETKQNAINCFVENTKQPLICSQLVKDFTKCVQNTRLRTGDGNTGQ